MSFNFDVWIDYIDVKKNLHHIKIGDMTKYYSHVNVYEWGNIFNRRLNKKKVGTWVGYWNKNNQKIAKGLQTFYINDIGFFSLPIYMDNDMISLGNMTEYYIIDNFNLNLSDKKDLLNNKKLLIKYECSVLLGRYTFEEEK